MRDGAMKGETILLDVRMESGEKKLYYPASGLPAFDCSAYRWCFGYQESHWYCLSYVPQKWGCPSFTPQEKIGSAGDLKTWIRYFYRLQAQPLYLFDKEGQLSAPFFHLRSVLSWVWLLKSGCQVGKSFPQCWIIVVRFTVIVKWCIMFVLLF